MTSKYERRNLCLAVIDDDLQRPLVSTYGLVDLVAFPPQSTARISSIEAHCRNAASEKEVHYDLLSIDINFQEDVKDPVRPSRSPQAVAPISEMVADPSIMTASGLYHGLALLARRQPTDEVRNVLPLAWEVRSATPTAFASRPDLRNDAVRGYALLRSLLASPREDETLEDCIRREFSNACHKKRQLLGGSLLEVMEADLLAQDISTGFVDNILQKLLPKWRRHLVDAVWRRDVVLNIPAIDIQFAALCA